MKEQINILYKRWTIVCYDEKSLFKSFLNIFPIDVLAYLLEVNPFSWNIIIRGTLVLKWF